MASYKVAGREQFQPCGRCRALALLLTLRLGNPDVNRQRLTVVAALADTARRRRAVVIEPDRESDVVGRVAGPAGDVEADPAEIVDPGGGPGVARDLAFIRGEQIARDIARRHAEVAAAGEEDMGVVLAHAGAEFERLGGGGMDVVSPDW